MKKLLFALLLFIPFLLNAQINIFTSQIDVLDINVNLKSPSSTVIKSDGKLIFSEDNPTLVFDIIVNVGPHSDYTIDFSFTIYRNNNKKDKLYVETSSYDLSFMDNSQPIESIHLTGYIYFQGSTGGGGYTIPVEEYDILVDDQGPTIEVAQNPTGWTNGNVTFTGTAADTVSGLKDLGGDVSQWDGDVFQLGINVYIHLIGGLKIRIPWLDSSREYTVNSHNEKIQFFAQDRLNNTGYSGVLQATNIDRTPPVVTATGTAWRNTSFTSTATVSDVLVPDDGYSQIDPSEQHRHRYRTYNSATGTAGGWSSWVAGLSRSFGETGEYQLEYEGKDRAGNTATSMCLVQIDKVAPVVSVTGSGWRNTDFPATGSATDSHSGIKPNSGFNRYKAPGSSSWTEYTQGQSRTITDEGISKVQFRFQDNAGNYGVTSEAEVRIDKTPPTCGIPSFFHDTPGDALDSFCPLTSLDIPALFNIADQAGLSGFAAGTLQYKTDPAASAWKSYSGPLDLNDFGSGLFGISIRFSDNAGNTATTPFMYTYLDTTPPVITPPASAWTDGDNLSFSANDGGSGVNEGSWRWRAGSGGIWKAFPISGLPEGENLISVRVSDYAGNIAVLDNVLIRIDIAAPLVTASLVTPGVESGGYYNLPSVTLNAVIDAGAGAPIVSRYYRINNGAQLLWNGIDNVTFSGEGSYSVVFYAQDEAGNTGESQALTFFIDRTAPVTRFNISTPGVSEAVWTNSDVSFSFIIEDTGGSGIDNSLTRFSTDGGETWDASYSTLLTGHGKHQFTVFAADRAGNAGTRSLMIWIDKEGPAAGFECDPYFRTSNATLAVSNLSASDADAGMGAVPVWEYSINNSAFAVFPAGSDHISDARLTDGTFPEGVHSLVFRTEDRLGNAGYSSPANFIIDRTAPVVSFVRIIDSYGSEVGENGYLVTNSADLSLAMSDSYISGGEVFEGVAAGFYCLLSSVPLNSPSVSGTYYAGNATSGSPLNGFSNGANYLYVWPVDSAGNTGEVCEKLVLFDRSSPQAPAIASSTHRKAVAVTDAMPFTDAYFTITPRGDAPSGISSYVWSLYKGADVIQEGNLFGDGLREISFSSLDDNSGNEFYTLEARAVGGNGRTGEAGSFRFRIDSSPPEHLVMYASPQVESSSWYRQKASTLSWAKPADMTGVKEYRYRVFSLPVEIPSSNEEKALYDISGWILTETEKVTVDLLQALSSAAGYAYAYVCAEDYSGNREFSSVTIQYDTVAPCLEELLSGEFLRIDADVSLRRATLTINSARDNLLEIDSALVPQVRGRLSEISESGVPFVIREYREFSGTTYIFDGLDADSAYLAEVSVTDAAGNSSVYRTAFRLDGEPVMNIAMPFENEYEGYFVSGTRTPAWSTAELSVTDVLCMTEIIDGQEYEGPFPFDELVFDPDTEEFSRGLFDESRVFSLSCHGFSMNAGGLEFSAEYGLSFGEAVLMVNSWDELLMQPVPRILTLSGLNIGFGPEFEMATVPFAEYAPGSFSFRSQTSKNTPGFVLSSISEAGLSGVSLALEGSTWNTEQLYTTRSVDIYSCPDGNEIRHRAVSVQRALIDDDKLLTHGSVALPLYIEAAGAIIEVTAAWLADDELVVADSSLLLPEGYEPERPAIRNFALTVDGDIVKKGGYFAEGFAWVDADGNSYEFGTIDIVGGSFFATDGTLTVAATGESYAVSGMQIGSDGFVYENPGNVSQGLSFELSGYFVESADAVVVQNGFLLRSATIKGLPAIFGGGDRVVDNLGVSFSGDSVTQAGVSTQSFVTGMTAYGNDVTILRLELRPDGLYAANSVITLADGISAAGSGWLYCTDLQLFSNGTFGTGPAGTGSAPFDMTVNGFELQASGAFFNGSEIVLPDAQLLLPYGIVPRTALIHGLSLGGEGIRQAGTSDEKFRYTANGWRYSLNGLEFGSAGLCSAASIIMPRRLGGREVVFPLFTLNADGTCVSGQADDGAIVRIGGWLTVLSGIEIDEDVLHADQGIVVTYASMGSAEFVFPEISMNSSGQFLSAGTGSGTRVFTSENGFKVEATSYALGNEGIRIVGDVHFPAALGEDVVASYTEESPAVLYYNGVIETIEGEAVQAVTCKVAGWDLVANSFYVDEKGLTITESELQMPLFGNASLVMPKLSFYSDGSIKAAGRSFENIRLGIFGGRFEIDKFAFSDRGLSAAAFVELPPVLGGYSIFFDNVTFHPGGRISTEASVPEVAFSIKKADIGFRFRNIRFDGTELRIGEGLITLPDAMEKRQVRISNFRIDQDGNFDLGGIGLDPFEMWGYTFFLDSIGISSTEMRFDGSILLPSGLPAGLGGRRLAIDNFVYNIPDNRVESFGVSLQGEFSFDLTQNIRLTVDTFGIRKEQDSDDILMHVDSGRLAFPSSSGLGDVEVFGIRINPKTLAFDFENIFIKGFTCSKFGLDFTLTRLSFNSQFDMSFEGSVKLPSGESVPELLRGQSLTIEKFEISRYGEIGDIEGAISLEGNMFNLMTLKGGNIGFSRIENALAMSIGGDLELSGASLPEGIRGKTIHITEFEVDTTDWSVLRFDAGVSGLSFNLFNLIEFRETAIHARNTDDGSFQFDLGGDIYLPEALPEFLRRDPLHISEFTIDSAGRISAFHVSKDFTGDNNLLGYITARDTHFEALYDTQEDRVVFNINGTTLILGENFPQGLRGTSATVTEFVFDSNGAIDDVDVTATIPDDRLFGKIPMRNAGFTLSRSGSSELIADIHGSLGMPDGTPSGFEDISIDITQLAFSSSGSIVAADFGIHNIQASLFGQLNLTNGSVHVGMDGTSALLFTVKGGLSFPATMPAPFSTMTFQLDPLAVSTSRGIVDFSARLGGAITFNLFAGIQGTCTSFGLSGEGISVAGNLSAPPSMPVIGGRTIVLENLDMNWNGQVTDISAGIDRFSTQLAGFTADVENLVFHGDHITIGKAELIMPAVLGRKRAGLKNASINYNGKFEGEFIAPDLRFDIAGFELILEEPSLNVDNRRISFARTRAKTPSLVGGGTLAINNMSIGPDGLSIGGAGFDLPSFKLANNIEFELRVNFAIDGSSYFVEGSGKIVVPAMGGFDVEASFTNKSSTYPWGLKRAYFAWESTGTGIPLGTTGLFMTGIRGGLAFGPPDELPAVVRQYFRNGTRIQAGFTVATSSDRIIQGKVDAWIDVTNCYFAIDGSVSVLNGFFSSEMTAALTGNLFYGRVAFELKVVKGEAELWIWKSGSKVKIAGQGSVKFGLQRGALFNKKILWKRIRIPGSDMWLFGAGAKFGQFTNGKSGFYGYSSFPIIGKIGFYAGTSGLKFGKLSGYNLRIPGGAAYNILQNRNIQTDGALTYLPDYSSLLDPQDPVSLRGADSAPSRVLYLDNQSPAGFKNDTYLFTVPGNTARKNITSRLLLNTVNSLSTETVQVNAVERIIFFTGYEEGAPVVTAVSPSGTLYGADFDNAEEFQVENGSALVIMYPEPGQWELTVNGLAMNQEYTIDVMGKTRSPELADLTPRYQGESARNGYTVEGYANWYSGTAATLYVNLVSAGEESAGMMVAEAVLESPGNFSVLLDMSEVPDGTYRVLYEIDDSDSVPFSMESDGTVEVVNTAVIPPVTGLLASRYDEMSLKISFEPLEGARVAGYTLYVRNGDEVIARRLGSISQSLIPGMKEAESYDIWITAYDAQGKTGTPSGIFRYVHQEVDSIINIPTIQSGDGGSLPASLELKTGESLDLPFICATGSLTETGDALEYAAIEVLDAPQWLSVLTDAPQYRLDGSEGLLSISTYEYTTESGDLIVPAPGEYSLRIALRNLANPDLYDEYGTVVSVSYPAPVINDVIPSEWHCQDSQEITIIGDNFIAGTRFYANDHELEVKRLENHEADFIIPAILPGGINYIRALGPDGSEAQFPVDLAAPGYVIQVFKHLGRETAGSVENFFFGITGYERFDESVSATVSSIPEGLSADSVAPVYSLDIGTVSVHIPQDAANGEYPVSLVTPEGYEMQFVIEVGDEEPLPEMRLVYPSAVLAGHEFSVFGNGFGDTAGTVLLDGRQLPVIQWNDDRIRVATTADLVSGVLSVFTADGVSAGTAPLAIKDTGFVLYPSANRLNLQPGDSARIQIALKGAALPVNLEAVATDSYGNPVFSASLEDTVVTPNGITFVNLSIGSDVQNGSYALTIRGTSDSYEGFAEVGIVIGDAFEITTEGLPAGMVDAEYYAKIEAENAAGPAAFSLDSGSLPLGLGLSGNGIISGKPAQPESKTFSIKAVDTEGHISIRSCTITVTENVWSMDGKDQGRSRFISTPGPAYGSADWQAEWTETGDPGETGIIAGDGRVFVWGESGLRVFEQNNGYLMWTNGLPVENAVYLGGLLYVQYSDSSFVCHDARYGNVLWDRQGVDAFTAGKGSVYLWQQREYSHDLVIITAESGDSIPEGYVTSIYENVELPGGTMFWYRDNLLCYDSSEIRKLAVAADGTAWSTMLMPAAAIESACASEENLVVLFADGKLSRYTFVDDSATAFLTIDEVQTGITSGTVLSSDRLFGVYGSSGTSLYSVGGGENRIRRTESAADAILSKDKLYLASSSGIQSVNIYDGSTIWQSSQLAENSRKTIVSNGRLFSLGSPGLNTHRLVSWSGEPNRDAPFVDIVFSPAVPDGSNGYYISAGTITLSARDRESYVAEKEWRTDSPVFQPYSGPSSIEEGTHSIVAWASDSDGKRSRDVVASYSADLTDPVTEIVIETVPVTGVDGEWYAEPPVFTLSAFDSFSGLERSEYRLNGGEWQLYSAPVTVITEGMNLVEYRSADFAGRVEEVRSAVLPVDLSLPVANHRVTLEPGIGVVYLEARDEGSGVKEIRYAIDTINAQGIQEGEWSVYATPVVVTLAGKYRLRYQAIDNTDRTGDMGTDHFTVQAYTEHTLFIDFEYGRKLPGRKIVEGLEPGDRIFSTGTGRHNKFDSVPQGLQNGFYLQPHNNDTTQSGNPAEFASFKAAVDILAWMMADPGTGQDLSGWTLTETAHPIEKDHYYRSGANVYQRFYQKGDDVQLMMAQGRNLYPSLYVIVPVNAQGILVTEPVGILAPGAALRISAEVLAGTARDTAIAVRIGDGEEEGLPVSYTGRTVTSLLNLPSAEEMEASGVESLNVSIRVYNPSAEKTKLMTLINLGGIEIDSPAPGSQILAGSTVAPVARILRPDGTEETEEEVLALAVWEQTHNPYENNGEGGSPWNPVEMINGYIDTPLLPGPWYLKARYNNRETIIRLNLTNASGEQTLTFGEENDINHTLGELLEQPDGSRYTSIDGIECGFSNDHTGNIVTFNTIQLYWPHNFAQWKGRAMPLPHKELEDYRRDRGGHSRLDKDDRSFLNHFLTQPEKQLNPATEEKKAIVFEDETQFAIRVNNGRYRVTVETGPTRALFGRPRLKINDTVFSLMPWTMHRTQMKLICEIEVQDGWLSISGEDYPVLSSISWEVLDTAAPAVKTRLFHIPGLLVTQILWPPGLDPLNRTHYTRFGRGGQR